MTISEYRDAQAALERAQQVVNVLFQSGNRGPIYDRAIVELMAARIVLHNIVESDKRSAKIGDG